MRTYGKYFFTLIDKNHSIIFINAHNRSSSQSEKSSAYKVVSTHYLLQQTTGTEYRQAHNMNKHTFEKHIIIMFT